MKYFLIPFYLLSSTYLCAEPDGYSVDVYLAAITASVSKPEDKKIETPGGGFVYVDKKPIFAWRAFKSIEKTTHFVGDYDQNRQEIIVSEVPCIRIVLNEADTKKLSTFKTPPHFQLALKFSDEDDFFIFANMNSVIQDGIILLTANLNEHNYQKLRKLMKK